MRKKPINSRAKGASGEREFAGVLKKRGLDARRGQQFSGGADSPDVICTSLTNIHFEVKRIQASKTPYDWMAQAKRDAKKKIPIVAHRRNGQEWIAVVRMEDLLELLIIREGFYL